MPGWLRRLATAGVLMAALGRACPAHEGPPFPIVVDEEAGPFVVSVWADPDVGTGTFFIIIEPAAGPDRPGPLEVRVCVQPATGRLPEACHAAARQPMRDREQYSAEVPFDRQEVWRIRVLIAGRSGVGEVSTEVEVTPPGLGRWDLALYLVPFALVGLLWLYGALRGSRPPAPAGPAAGDRPADAPDRRGGPGPGDPCPASPPTSPPQGPADRPRE